MAVLNDGINVPEFTRPLVDGSMRPDDPPGGPPREPPGGPLADTIELVSALTVDDVLARVRDGELDAETVVAAERRGKQRTGVLAPLT